MTLSIMSNHLCNIENLVLRDSPLMIYDCRLRCKNSLLGGFELLNLKSAFFNLKSLRPLGPDSFLSDRMFRDVANSSSDRAKIPVDLSDIY